MSANSTNQLDFVKKKIKIGFKKRRILVYSNKLSGKIINEGSCIDLYNLLRRISPMKNCPFCNEPINDEALKCPSCRQWLVDTTKLKKKKSIFPWLIGLIIIICFYHSLVVKAMQSAEVRECFKFRDLPEEPAPSAKPGSSRERSSPACAPRDTATKPRRFRCAHPGPSL